MLKIENGSSQIEIIQFLSFDEWCGKGDCPHEARADFVSIIDPEALKMIRSVKKGARMLVLARYDELLHLSYFTFESLEEIDGCIKIISSERSAEGNQFFFTGEEGLGLDVFAHFIKYVALIESDVSAFGKWGRYNCFIKALSMLSGISFRELDRQIRNHSRRRTVR